MYHSMVMDGTACIQLWRLKEHKEAISWRQLLPALIYRALAEKEEKTTD